MSRTSSGPERVPAVLFVDSYPYGVYGAQLTLLDLATGVRGIMSTALVVDEGEVASRLRDNGVEVIVLRYPTALRRYDGALLRLSALARVKGLLALGVHNVRVVSLLRRRRPDVVYCANIRSVMSVGVAAKVLRRPVVWHVQSFNGSAGALDRVAARLSTRIVTISSGVDRVFGARFSQRFEHKLVYVPIGFDPEHWTPPSTRSSVAETARLVSVGSISRDKGLDVLIRALHRVAATVRVQLDIIGAPKSTEDQQFAVELRELIDDLQLGAIVRWHGHVDDIRPLLADTDLLVSASLREGVPRSIAEVMMLAIPVVATDVGAVGDLVVDGVTGYLVAPNDHQPLASAIVAAVTDRSALRQLGLRGREHVVATYTSERFLGEFGAVLRDLAHA